MHGTGDRPAFFAFHLQGMPSDADDILSCITQVRLTTMMQNCSKLFCKWLLGDTFMLQKHVLGVCMVD